MSYLQDPWIFVERAVAYIDVGQTVHEAVIQQVVGGPQDRVDLAYWEGGAWVQQVNVPRGDTKSGSDEWSWVSQADAGLGEMEAPVCNVGRFVTYFDDLMYPRDAVVTARGGGLLPVLDLEYYNATTGLFVAALAVPHRENAGRNHDVWRWVNE